MTIRFLCLLLLITTLCGPALAASDPPAGSITPQVQELQQKMLGDEQTMALIMSLQNDPEMQTLLNDPAVRDAVQGGDIGTLMANPRFLKLLENEKVKEIGKRVGK